MSARKILFNVHLCASMAAGLLLAVTGLSGTALVYRHEIDELLNPTLLRVEPGPARVPVEAVLAAVRRAHPGEPVRNVFPPRTDHGTYEVQTGGPTDRRVYVDPYTGRVLGARVPRDTAMGFLFALHADLLGGGRGRTVVGVGGGVLLLLGMTGLALWWPGLTNLRRGLRVQRRAGWRRLNFDLHRVGGVLVLPGLALAAVTGMSLVFSAALTRAAHAALGSRGAARPAVLVTTPPEEGAVSAPLGAVLQRADAALPGGRTTRIALPDRPGGPVVVRKRMPSEVHPNGMSFVHLDAHTGEVLAVTDASVAAAGDRVLHWRYPLHVGAVGGPLVRLATAAAGLAPAALLLTGAAMWWVRTRSRARVGRRNRPAEPGTSVRACDPVDTRA